MATSVLYQPKHQPDHYMNFEPNEENSLLTARISEKLKLTPYHFRYIIKAERIETTSKKETPGKVLLIVIRDSLTKEI